jgi:hypothetical protein
MTQPLSFLSFHLVHLNHLAFDSFCYNEGGFMNAGLDKCMTVNIQVGRACTNYYDKCIMTKDTCDMLGRYNKNSHTGHWQ